MSTDPSRLSIAELRRRFVDGAEPLPPQALKKLRRDARQGARRIAAALERRRRAERDERLRLERLLHFERVLWESGVERVAGVDEAGVGPLAGPVAAAAVVFPPGTEIAGVDDSKRLTAEEREGLEVEIRERAIGIGIGCAEVEDIDRLNVYQASLVAMRRAVEALPEPPQHLLVDAREVPEVEIPQNRFDQGDGLSFSIAAASIVAKTWRDRRMEELDRLHPGYGFARHKGYATPEHQEAIRRRGPCPIHRSSYGYLRELQGECSEAFYRLRERLDGVSDPEELVWVEGELERLGDALPPEERAKLRTLLARRRRRI
jgi:ribonuclease HII